MNLAEWLNRSARQTPGAPALFRGEALLADYAGLARRVMHLAGGLGVAPGDRVALFMANCPAYLEALYAIWFAGAVAVPVNAKLHAKEAAWIVENSGARLVLADDDGAAALAPLLAGPVLLSVEGKEFAALRQAEAMGSPVERGPDDLAWLFYTSGTTGRPKGVMLSNANLQAMTLAYLADVDEALPSDAALYAAPISHGAGLYNFVNMLRGARHVVPESGGFDAGEVLALGRRLGGITLFAAPTMVRRLVDRAKQEGSDGEGLRTIVYGGGPMYLADIEEAVAVMGPRFVQIYGQGESPMTITALPRASVADRAHPRWRERLASVGRAHSVVEVRVADAAGRPLPDGEIGEILVRGSPVMPGYWQNPAATASTLRDGWLWTGDMGVLDADGYLTLKDRSKDVIITGGANVYPREVEEVLLRHPAVHEVAVVGRPDPEWGESIVAFVVPAAGHGLDAADLDRHCRDEIARFKRPKEYRALADLPKNNYGKVVKTQLRALLSPPE